MIIYNQVHAGNNMKFRWWWAVLLWVLFTFGPILGLLVSSAIANALGCQLDEGNTYPCKVAGVDIGELLSTMFVMTWLALVTVPTGLMAGMVGLIIWGVKWLSSRR